MRPGQAWDVRRRFLLSVVTWGLVFFSIPLNKLPGYLLPLLPSFLCCWECLRASTARRHFTCVAGRVRGTDRLYTSANLDPALITCGGQTGRDSLEPLTKTEVVYLLFPIVLALVARFVGRLVAHLVRHTGGLYLKAATFPAIDANVSARSLWRKIVPIADEICDGGTNRDWIFGLSYYRGASFPPCGDGKFPYVLRTRGAAFRI